MIRFPLFGAGPEAEPNDSTPAGGQEAPASASSSGRQAAHPLDALTGGVFSAATSGDRAARVRAWLATEPDLASMQEVFKELSARDKGAAKALREKLDEIKRSKGQELLAEEWGGKAEQLLQTGKLNIADAMAWQRDAAKAGAPLSKEPLASLKQRLAERIKAIEDLQTRVQVHREAAVLLAQRIEVLSTKSWKEADAAEGSLNTDVAHWREQAQALQQDAAWPSVDPKHVGQLESAVEQLQLVVRAFEDALGQTRAAVEDAARPLPPVPVWADEIRSARGEELPPAAAEAGADVHAPAAPADPAQAQRRADAEAAVQAAIGTLEQELISGHSKASVAAAQALRNALKEHRKQVGHELEGKAHAVLASAGELEGWQRWRADQIRQELVQQAEALIDRPEPIPAAAADKVVQDETSAQASNETSAAGDGVPAVSVTGQEEAPAPAAPAEEAAPPAAEPEAVAEQAYEAEAAVEPAPAQGEPETGGEAASPAATEAAAAEQAAPVISVKAKAAAKAKARPAGPRPMPTSKLSPRKLQEILRHLREQWKQTDQGGVPNHALWKRFDAACNEAYRIVEAWLASMKEHAAEQKSARLHLMDELKTWGEQHAQQVQNGVADWKAAHRDLLNFSRRWREAGHLSEKVFAELQPRWKAAMAEAGTHLEAAQKASVQVRQAMIDEARELGEAASLRIDAIKTLQQRWQHEAQAVPLERKHEQKLWDAFRKPLDEAFQRKHQQREQAQAAVSEHDKVVVDAAKALEVANASGDAQAIQAAVRALEEAIRGQREAAAEAASQAEEAPAAAPAPVESAPAEEGAPRPPSASALQHRPAIAVRGDDRPQARMGGAAAGKAQGDRRDGRGDRRDGRPGDRNGPRGRFGDSFERGPRAPRLGDTAFRAQRDALDHAQAALRKLAEQAHGETITHLLGAWEKRQPDAVPSASELGKAVPGAQRSAWVSAVATPAKAGAADTALLRLEMAAEVPTPADQLTARRALQLQLLTRRHDPAPQETWISDVAQVLSDNHDAARARRLQQALKVLLRK